jgi:hypothetical protein
VRPIRSGLGGEARQRLSRDARGYKKGVWTGARAGEPWFVRLKKQLICENAYDGEGDQAEMHAVLWAFGKDVARYGQKRKLRLKGGKTKSLPVAYAASPVRSVPASVFHGKLVFPTGKQWHHRLGWFEPRLATTPAKAKQLYRPPEGRYRQRYPFWAAPSAEDLTIKAKSLDGTPVEVRATELRGRIAHIQELRFWALYYFAFMLPQSLKLAA